MTSPRTSTAASATARDRARVEQSQAPVRGGPGRIRNARWVPIFRTLHCSTVTGADLKHTTTNSAPVPRLSAPTAAPGAPTQPHPSPTTKGLLPRREMAASGSLRSVPRLRVRRMIRSPTVHFGVHRADRPELPGCLSGSLTEPSSAVRAAQTGSRVRHRRQQLRMPLAASLSHVLVIGAARITVPAE
jgi:hypothetical protein